MAGTEPSSDQPDFEGLLRSPYDPDPEPPRSEGESDLPWVPAVVAACLGALAVGAFVVFAVATGPDGDEVDDAAVSTTSSTTTTIAPVQADGPPDGFEPLTDEVAAQVVDLQTLPHATVASVVTAVNGGTDSGEVEPVEVAYWVLRSGDDELTMVRQYTSKFGIGNVTVEFDPQTSLTSPTLVPFVATGSPVVDVTTLELDTTLPQSLEPFEITVGETTISIEELSFDTGWGWLAWSSEGGPASIDPTITFVGTNDPQTDGDDPTQLVPLSRQPFAFSTPANPLPTPMAFDGAESLVRAGEPVAGENLPTGIVVELVVTVPSSIFEGPPLPVPVGS